MKESHLLDAACVYDFGLAASSMSGRVRSQLVQTCDGLRDRRHNWDVYSIPTLRLFPKLIHTFLFENPNKGNRSSHVV